jgi:hypothetical protein
MELSCSGGPYDHLIPWQKIKGKEWSYQEIGLGRRPSEEAQE